MNPKSPRQVANTAAAKVIVGRMMRRLDASKSRAHINDVDAVYAIGVALTAIAVVSLFAAMTGAA
jgi:hypothetical protein